MKALSIHAPYAFEIFTGQKVEEYRSWQTPYRGDLLICTSKRWYGADYLHGHALCIVNLYDIEKLGDRDYAWLLKDVRYIEPFPVKGKLHLFEVDDDKIIEIPAEALKLNGEPLTTTEQRGLLMWSVFDNMGLTSKTE